MPTYKSPEDAPNELMRLLLTAVPENHLGNKTIVHLANLMDVNRWSINKWVAKQRLGPDRVLQLVEISRIMGYTKDGAPILGKPRVTRDQFDPFIYNY